jgi:hypothetical protein
MKEMTSSFAVRFPTNSRNSSKQERLVSFFKLVSDMSLNDSFTYMAKAWDAGKPTTIRKQ